MAQDPFGQLWLGRRKGLLSFDGSDFSYQAFRDSSSLNITAIACDSSFVYTGYEDGKIARYSLKSWGKEFVMDTNLHATITAIVPTSSGDLYIATYGNGLFIKNGNHVTRVTKDDGLPENEIYCMIAGEKDNVWLGTDGGLTKCTLSNGQPVLKSYSTKDGLPDEIVRCLSQDDSGKIWIGTYDKGVCIFNPASGKITIPPSALTGRVALSRLLHRRDLTGSW
jgi:ligand-binding sensor domain-containing protein